MNILIDGQYVRFELKNKFYYGKVMENFISLYEPIIREGSHGPIKYIPLESLPESFTMIDETEYRLSI